MNEADKLKSLKVKPPKRRDTPLWDGPESDGDQGGVTQSLLGRFLCCRERFRLKVFEGLQSNEGFNPRLEYGNMWHVCEEELAAMSNPFLKLVSMSGEGPVGKALTSYCKELCRKYPLDQAKIEHWYQLCKAFFPLYVEHWRNHPDVKERTPLLQEQTFRVPYKLPSGRVVYLRGKWDAVDLIGKGKTTGIYIQENKTKSSVDATKLLRQLKFDLQTMFYTVALINVQTNGQGNNGVCTTVLGDDWKRLPVAGVRYNVIRRPAHKSVESALKKFEDDRADNRTGEWFARFRAEITPQDVQKFRQQCLDPILENLCWWWEDITTKESDYPPPQAHWRHPFGIYNPMDEGGFSDVDAYLENGSTVGLTHIDNLFPEL